MKRKLILCLRAISVIGFWFDLPPKDSDKK